MKKKYLILILAIIVICLSIDFNKPKFELSKKAYGSEIYTSSITDEIAYENYKTKHPQLFPSTEVVIDVTNTQNFLFEKDPEVPDELDAQVSNYSGLCLDYLDPFNFNKVINKQGLYIPETGTITFKLNVPNEGYYNLGLSYYTLEGRSGNISRGLLVNNALPFKEAKSFSMSRYWKDSFQVGNEKDDSKNEMRPSPVEENAWAYSSFQDNRGYYGEPYKIYFKEGDNTITFTSIREPLVLNKIELYQEKAISSYQQIKQVYTNKNYPVIQDYELKTQGEHAIYKSSPTLMPIANYSNNKLEPYIKFITRYNTIGATNWEIPGDSITWQIDIPESGLYELSFKVLQNYNQGMSVSRELSIDGKIPFKEAQNITIPYKSDWQYYTIGGKENPYLFYLDKGTHDLTLKCTIGVYGDVTRKVEETILNLRNLYRDVVMRTGLQPDPYQDYQLYTLIKDLEKRIKEAKASLENAKDTIISVSGERSSMTSSFDRAIYQLEQFLKSEKNIQKGLSEFDNNIAALGSWVMTVSEQPLAVDYFNVHGSNHKSPKVAPNFFQKIGHEFVMFFGSFFADTQLKSSIELEDAPEIKVWITTGRDQSQIIRQMIDEQFVVQNNVNVNLQLVSSSLLLNAIAAGVGPDIAIGVPENVPVNYGIRNAIVDLSKFSDFEEVAKNFHSSAITPYTFNDKVYALPDTHDFMVQYIRNDIMNEIGISSAPKTWDEVINLLPKLQNRYFDYYIQTTQGSLSPTLYSMIKQYGGDLYKGEYNTAQYGYASNLDEEKTRDAFLDFTNFFYAYGFPVEANFVNRFRSGEMPIGVDYYTVYNTFSVFAPEITGLWSYAPYPGTEKTIVEKGVSKKIIDNSSASKTTATIMLSDSKEQDSAWKFIKWWLGKDAQIGYARNMEAILGAAGRYATANLEAFDLLPWPTKDKNILQKQRENAKGIPVVPGDYIVGRYIDNAFRDVINNGVNAFDSLYKKMQAINEELERKRKEFGL